MGSTSSLIQNKLQDPEYLHQYHHEIAHLFASSCDQIKTDPSGEGKEGKQGGNEGERNYTKEELKEKFQNILKENESQIISNIAKQQQQERVQKQSSLKKLSSKGGNDTEDTAVSSKILPRSRLNFLVCVNGTLAGDLGYKSTTLHLMNKYDTITLFNLSNPNDLGHIPLKYHPKQIQDKYYSQLINTLQSNQYYFHFTQSPTNDITTALVKFIQLYHPDLSTSLKNLNDYAMEKFQEPFAQPPPPDFLVIGKNRFVLEKMESGIIEDPTETAPLHHPEVIQRVNSGPIGIGPTQESQEDVGDGGATQSSAPVSAKPSHPPSLSKDSRGQSGSWSFRESDSEKKDGNHSVGYTLLGSSDISLGAIHLPCIVIKSFVHSTEQTGATYLLAVNETLRSRRGLDILKKLLNPKDTVRMLYVTHRDTTTEQLNEVQSYYGQEIKYYCPVNSSLTVMAMAGRMLPDVILQYAMEISCDFIAISPRPKYEKKEHAMSVTEQILLKSNCNVVICKN
jgi:nucleotide-binding universal stress UspA family protein